MSIPQISVDDPSALAIIGARAVGRDAFPDFAKANAIAEPVKTDRTRLPMCGLGFSRLCLHFSGSLPTGITFFFFVEKVPPPGGEPLRPLPDLINAQIRAALFRHHIVFACKVVSGN